MNTLILIVVALVAYILGSLNGASKERARNAMNDVQSDVGSWRRR